MDNPTSPPPLPVPPPLAVFLAAAAAFSPVLKNGFVAFEDPQALAGNPFLQAPAAALWKWVFLSFHPGGVYEPMRWASYAFDRAVWGMNPSGYHLTSLLLHALNAALLYFLASRLLKDRTAALFSALLFGLHPLRVEAVAWASARGILLATTFYLVAVLACLRARGGEGGRWKVLSLAAFALCLLSRQTGQLVLPFTFLVFDFWPLGRLGGEAGPGAPEAKDVLKEWTRYLGVGVVCAVLEANARYSALAFAPPLDLGTQAARAMFGAAFYIEKTLLPTGLAFLHTLPEAMNPFDKLNTLSTTLVAATTAALWLRPGRRPALAAGWAFYLLTLAPTVRLSDTLGALRVAADSWSYLPSVALSIAAGGAYPEAARLLRERWSLNGQVILTPLLALLAASSFLQAGTWRDDDELLARSVRADPACWFCHEQIAVRAGARGRWDEAVSHGLEAVRHKPDYFVARLNLIPPMTAKGMTDEAIGQCREALEVNPRSAEAEYNLGFLLSQKGRLDDAIAHTRAAVALNPAMPNARNNLGYFLQQKGMLPEAVEQYREALRLQPGFPNAEANLRAALSTMGR